MSPEILIARLQAACYWDWMPGILCRDSWGDEYRILEITGTRSQNRANAVISIPKMSYSRPEDCDVPTLSLISLGDLKLSENAVKDPATRGCILAMVRRAHGKHCTPRHTGDCNPRMENEGGLWVLEIPAHTFSATTEIEVLLRALETQE